MDRDAHLIAEAYDGLNEGSGEIKQFIDFYKRRTEELAAQAGHEGSATGEFMFDLSENGTLHVACDVIHSDTILGSLPPEVVGRTGEEIDAFITKYDIGHYIPKVVEALRETGLEAGRGLVSGLPLVMGREGGIGSVSVNSYTGDTLTVQLDLKNFEQQFAQNKQRYATALDTFIAKMFAAIKLLNTKYFKSQPLPPEAQ